VWEALCNTKYLKEIYRIISTEPLGHEHEHESLHEIKTRTILVANEGLSSDLI
jgi:hypothetical protein